MVYTIHCMVYTVKKNRKRIGMREQNEGIWLLVIAMRLDDWCVAGCWYCCYYFIMFKLDTLTVWWTAVLHGPLQLAANAPARTS